MPLHLSIRSLLRSSGLLLAALLAACGGGGGGGGGGVNPSPVSAAVPAGSGQVAIDMVGLWRVEAATFLDSNDPVRLPPPPAGTVIEIGATGIVSIGGLPVERALLEAALGFPLTLYVNQLDGKTLFYGLRYDRLAQGGGLQDVGLAGGSLDADSISVEQFTSLRDDPASDAVFTRVRYRLRRVLPVGLPVRTEAPAGESGGSPAGLHEIEALRPLFGAER